MSHQREPDADRPLAQQDDESPARVGRIRCRAFGLIALACAIASLVLVLWGLYFVPDSTTLDLTNEWLNSVGLAALFGLIGLIADKKRDAAVVAWAVAFVAFVLPWG